MHTTHNFLVVKPGQDDRQDAFSDTVRISSLLPRRRRCRRHVVHLFTLVAPLRKIDSLFFDASRARVFLCVCFCRAIFEKNQKRIDVFFVMFCYISSGAHNRRELRVFLVLNLSLSLSLSNTLSLSLSVCVYP